MSMDTTVDTVQSPCPPAATLAQSLVSISAAIGEHALTASVLGTERSGHGVVIRPDGLIVTIGYVVADATELWITTHTGDVLPGVVVSYDYESGFGLIRPTRPVHLPALPLGSVRQLNDGDPVMVLGSRGDTDLVSARVVARQEFAGRWEYVLDEAVFTAPTHANWAGTALIDKHGALCGVGSLLLQGLETASGAVAANMFVPIDLLAPIVDDLCDLGTRRTPARPWLGLLVQDEDDGALTVVGIFRNCPAEQAGCEPGDQIIAVDGEPIEELAQLFRRIWAVGPAGVDVPVTLRRGDEMLTLSIRSADRNLYFDRGTTH